MITFDHVTKRYGDALALDDVSFGAETLGIAAATIGVDRRRVGQVLDLVGLSVAESRRTVKGYSLGMRQRLGIAQALLGAPRALVLDEPANGLDPQGIRATRDLLRAVADDGCAVLLSSHLLHEVAQLADHVVIIGRGRILEATEIDHTAAQDLESRYFSLTSTNDRSAA